MERKFCHRPKFNAEYWRDIAQQNGHRPQTTTDGPTHRNVVVGGVGRRIITNINTTNSEDDFEPWEVALLYHFVLAVAGFVTLSCPVIEVNQAIVQQRTVVWDGTEWNWKYVLEACIIYTVISFVFFILHKSDPGRLSPSLMDASTTSIRKDRDSTLEWSTPTNRREWCPHCQLYPPLRAHHCKQCRCCVATFDHHCEFVATCIGERNRCRFWWLLFVQVLGVTRCGLVLYPVHSTPLFRWSYWRTCPGVVLRLGLAKIFVAFLALAAIFLFLLHTVYALTNSTTFEFSRSKHLTYLNGISPYSFPFCEGTLAKNLHIYGCGLHLNQLLIREKLKTSWKPILWQPPNPTEKRHVVSPFDVFWRYQPRNA